jgi:hypothetical protein
MAGLAWFELDIDFSDHPKTVALAVALRNPLAEAYVSRLWAYCYRHALDRFTGLAAVATIEQATRWKGKTGHLVTALVDAGFLDREGEDLVAHGVADRLAPHLAKRERDSVAARERRAKAAGPAARRPDVAPTSPRHRDDVEWQPDRDQTETRPDQLPAVRPADDLGGFRDRLGSALGLPKPVVVGKKPAEVIAFFKAQLEAVGEDALLHDCCEIAKRSTTGTPSTLSWFVGWLERLPVPQEVAHADTG